MLNFKTGKNMRIVRSMLVAVGVIAVGATAAQAQGVSGSVTATAQVFRPLTVAGQANLDFGNVFPGVNKSIAITDAAAGRFFVTGQTSGNVQLTFTSLPGTLSDLASNLLTIDSWTAGHNTTNNAAGATTFTPAAGTSTALSGGNPGELYVWVGARVVPGASQPGGTYTGDVTLTVAYF